MAKLGEICTVVSGTTPKSARPEYWDGDLNWITPAELTDESDVIYETQRKITQQAVIGSNLKSFPAGTVLLSSRAPIGKVAIAGTEMYCNQGFKNLVCSDKIFNRYLYHFLKSKTDYLNSLGRGATFKEISKSIVENIEIPLPPIDEQRKIAVVLDKVSDLIAKRRQQLDKLDEMVKSRFVEMFGDLADPDCKYMRYKLEEICISSDDIKCGPFGTQLNKNEYQEHGIAVWEIPQINNEFKNLPTHFLTSEKAKQLDAYSLIPGDIAMSRKGNVGRCALFPKGFAPGIIHSDVLRIRVDNSRVNPCFLMYQLHFSKAVTHQIEMVSSGAVMAGINVTKLKQIYIHIPAFNLQQQFSTFVEQVEKTKTTISRSLEQLETLKKALMQEYFEVIKMEV